jgi:predicted metal-dependent hydrolase
MEIRGESGLTVVVPRKYSLQNVHEVLEKKADWILRHLPGQGPVQVPLFRKQVDHGEKVPFMDRKLEVIIGNDGERPGTAYLKGNKLTIAPTAGKDRAYILERWYRKEAAHIFKEKADIFQRTMGLQYNRITIRGQEKRWASASPRGNLSINWKLLLAPEIIIDYVIMHELAHFKHMDHSKKFWGFLEKYCPNWREYRKWLVTHEDELKASATFSR